MRDQAKSFRFGGLPWLLFGLMTLAAFGGPFLIALVLRGGQSPDWPPDRPIEWAVFLGTCGFVVLLMVISVSIGMLSMQSWKQIRERQSRPKTTEPHQPTTSPFSGAS